MKKFFIVTLLGVYSTLGTAVLPQRTPVAHTQQDIKCLAKNIYHEARGEPILGQVAVAQVTVNRFKSGKHGKNICATVYQKHQFSWTNKPVAVRDYSEYARSYTIAQVVLSGQGMPEFPAHFYHAKSVSPVWVRKKRVIKVIGNHVFYS